MKTTFPLALTFLTVIPWPGASLAGPQDLARSMFWFPWVGAILGLIYIAAWTGMELLLPGVAAAAILVALSVLLTAGLHLDGLADTFDGLGGGGSPEARLRIMKDSRLGTFGAVSLVIVLLLKFAFLLSLAGRGTTGAVFLFPVVSRWGMVLLAYLSPYARPEGGLGQAMTMGVDREVLAGATAGALALSFLALGLGGVILLAGAAGFIWLASRYFQPKLGGVTGDVLGAANELLEVLVLAGALLLSPVGLSTSWFFW